MELLVIFPWLLGAAVLVNLFDNDDDNDGNSSNVVGNPPGPGTVTELTDGNDTFNGTPEDDQVSGEGGDDTLRGTQGNDDLFGRSGNDKISGGQGSDILTGGPGNDFLDGFSEDDYLIGNIGKDALYGKDGDDILFGGFGSDNLFGGSGDDQMAADRGTDFVRGGQGNDIVSGNLLYPQTFDAQDASDIRDTDTVTGISDLAGFENIKQIDDLEADTVYGDAGNDTLYLGHKDVGFGGAGEDAFVISAQSGASAGNAAQINDFSAEDDQIILEYTGDTAPVVTFAEDNNGNVSVLANNVVVATLQGAAGSMNGVTVTLQSEDGTQNNVVVPNPPTPHPFDNPTELTSGDDTFAGTPDVDVIEGNAGNDQISGLQENDALFGRDGNDGLFGNDGDDVLVGGRGDDVLVGSAGNDFMAGNQNADAMFGGQGNDSMYGGFNGDRMFGADGDDSIAGDKGVDFIRGGSGNDFLSGNNILDGFPNAKTSFDVRAGLISETAAAQQFQLVHVDDLEGDVVYGDAGDDRILLGDKDYALGGAGDDTFFIGTQSGTTQAAEIADFVSGEDSVVVEYTGDTAPTITIGDDGDGNATVVSNGVVVAILTGQAGNVLSSDVDVFNVQPSA